LECLGIENFAIFYDHLEYFMTIWNILWPFGIFYDHLEYWYNLWPFGTACGQLAYFPHFGVFGQRKSGHPGAVLRGRLLIEVIEYCI
jgi:hypothetical protein